MHALLPSRWHSRSGLRLSAPAELHGAGFKFSLPEPNLSGHRLRPRGRVSESVQSGFIGPDFLARRIFDSLTGYDHTVNDAIDRFLHLRQKGFFIETDFGGE